MCRGYFASVFVYMRSAFLLVRPGSEDNKLKNSSYIRLNARHRIITLISRHTFQTHRSVIHYTQPKRDIQSENNGSVTHRSVTHRSVTYIEEASACTAKRYTRSEAYAQQRRREVGGAIYTQRRDTRCQRQNDTTTTRRPFTSGYLVGT